MFDARVLNVAIELWGATLCMLGIISTLMFMGNNRRESIMLTSIFSTSFMACAGDAVAGIFRGQPGQLAWIATHVGNLVSFLSNIILLAVYTSYLCSLLERAGGTGISRWRYMVWVAATVMSALTITGVFYHIDAQNLYHRNDLFWITYVYSAAICVEDGFLVISGRGLLDRRTFTLLLVYCITPAIAMSIQVFVYGSLNFLAVAEVLVGLMLFLQTMATSARTLVERTEELAQSRIEVSDSRIRVMVSQIQPHFLFNTLDSIYYLCAEDPARAQTAVDHFSTYLRANLNSLSQTKPVSVETELDHVRTYLELEKISMEDLLNWQIDAQAGGFLVPALSLQTLAENAVKHGLSKKVGGGTLTVRTYEEGGWWVATVEDDGVGFDATAPGLRQGVGIENTRMRLSSMCHGVLRIESKPGIGTKAVVRIPKNMPAEPSYRQASGWSSGR